jgi:hypothetical protein
MAKTQIEIQNEEHFNTVRSVLQMNGKKNLNREKVLNNALEIAHNFITGADEDTFLNLTNLKKTF